MASGPGEERWLIWPQGVRKHSDNLTVWVAEDVHRLLDRELKRARIVAVSSSGRQLDVAKDLPPLIDVL